MFRLIPLGICFFLRRPPELFPVASSFFLFSLSLARLRLVFLGDEGGKLAFRGTRARKKRVFQRVIFFFRSNFARS